MTVLTRAMKENELLTAALDALLYRGFYVHHDRRSDKALQQGTPGFPDIAAVHPDGRLLFIECKTEVGHLTTAQNGWLLALGKTARAFVLRPVDLDAFLRDPYVAGAKL